jgi:Txe/YoeB family toxin of toxin-antitoxin system
VSWELVYSKQARKDALKIDRAGLRQPTTRLLKILETNPFQNPPPFEKLLGHYTGTCSRRINIHHRLIYQVVDETRTVKILRMWTHYK